MEVPTEETTTSLSPECVQMQLPTPSALSSTQAYQYAPLKHDSDIRLLYLLPGSDNAPLSCSLRIVSLSALPVYEAISYTWGEPIFSASIDCFSKGQLPITENLSKALFHLRLGDRIRVLWVDAICINQQDLAERSHQVTLLRDTFESAENVIIWLGEDTGDAKEAFDILRTIDHFSLSDKDIRSFLMLKGHKVLEKLLERSWFRRIWVIQELICAMKATITCGSHAMEWERFLDVAARIKSTRYYGPFGDESVHNALYSLGGMRRERQLRQQREKTHLETMLYSYRCCLASDPRDKVFALVGIANEQNAVAYTPDYTKDVLKVYRDLAIHLIIAGGHPDILVNCAHITRSHIPHLPSWAPDWSQPLLANCSPMIEPGIYNAAARTSFAGRVSEDLDELFLDGVLLNKVEVLGSAWYLDAYQVDPVKYLKRTIELNEGVLDIFRQSTRYRDSYWSAFTRALVADKDRTGSRIGQRDLSEGYFTYRRYTTQVLLSMVTQQFSFREESESALAAEYLEVNDLDSAISHAASGRNFCLFDDGRVGWVPKAAEVGDRIAVFRGATVPILLRPRGNGYIVLSEVYVHELMDGQAFEGPDVAIETITLI